MAADRLVDCALTERAKKKLGRPSKRRRKEQQEEVTEPQDARQSLPPPGERGVIYLGHIPHGFYEEEIRSYFTQFGTVTRLKLYRSKKESMALTLLIQTGRARGYAFIEFEFPEVAAIAAESMNNYLMFDKLLKCRVVEPSDVRSNMLTPSNTVASEERTRLEAQRQLNRPRSVPEAQRRLSRLLSRESHKRKRLAELGLDYEFSGYRGICDATAITKKPIHITFTDSESEEGESGDEVAGEGESE